MDANLVAAPFVSVRVHSWFKRGLGHDFRADAVSRENF